MINLTIELLGGFFALVWIKTADWIIEMHIHRKYFWNVRNIAVSPVTDVNKAVLSS